MKVNTEKQRDSPIQGKSLKKKELLFRVSVPSKSVKGDWNTIKVYKGGLECDCVAHKYIKDKHCRSIKLLIKTIYDLQK